MANLPSTERILLGPGPSMITQRVLGAMGAPMLSHLDPDFAQLMDETRAGLQRLFRADAGAFTIAISGTGTSGMEAAVANTLSHRACGEGVTTISPTYLEPEAAASAISCPS